MKNINNRLRTFFLLVFVMATCFVAYSQKETTNNKVLRSASVSDDTIWQNPNVYTIDSDHPAAKEEVAPDASTEPETTAPKKVKPTRTFVSTWLIDNQTVTVPTKGSSQMDIMHRFGPCKNGYKDFFGFFASSNIRLGYNYVPIENLMVGASLTKANMTWEFIVKYAIIKQTKGTWWKYFSLTYFGDMAVESRKKDFYIHKTDRLSYFHQLILARRFHERIAIEVAPSWTHYNVVDGYFSEPGVVSPARKHDHFAISVNGSIMLKKNMNFMINWDQPLTKHKSGNPHPNLAFGIEFATSGHAFQVFAGQYYSITPQRNNYFNQNGWKYYLLGFNITRLWNF